MAPVSSKSKSARAKLPKSRPQSTSQLSQPVTDDAWTSTILSAFSPDAELFALVSLAVDRHRLRVFNVHSSQAVAEHVLQGVRATALLWIHFDPSEGASAGANGVLEQTPKKKRKKLDRAKDVEKDKAGSSIVQAVALGLSDGTVQIFSIAHGRVVRTLAESASSAPILALEESRTQEGGFALWTSNGDGVIRLWDTNKNVVLTQVSTENNAQYTALAVRPHLVDNDALDILAASNSIQLLSVPANSSASKVSAKEHSSYTGHASVVKTLRWEPTTSERPNRFYTSAEGDRFVYIWDSADASSKGKLAASCPVDTDVRQAMITNTQNKQILFILSNSGRISLAPVPIELTATSLKNSTKAQVPTLLPRSTIVLVKKKSGTSVNVVDFAIDPKNESVVRVAISGGAQIGFETARYLDDNGDFIPEVGIEYAQTAFASSKENEGHFALQRRYAEPTDMSISAGEHVGSANTIESRELDGVLDVDLAELSLGQRLTVRKGNDMQVDPRSSDSDAEGSRNDDAASEPVPSSHPRKQKTKTKKEKVVPVHSLSRTLTQALHSSDTGLLESCLRHSNKDLIYSTVQRLPPQLVVPLLMACVERLGRGARGNNMKGGGGGASTQRGLGLIAWVKAALTIHSGHLLTMPDLVARLSHLHATLTSRLALQDQLLGLSGRLDLVLAQVELRSSSAPAPIRIRNDKSVNGAAWKKTGATEPQKYVEGESSDESNDHVEVGVEDAEGEGEGSVEDVELGGLSDELGSEEGDSEDDIEDSDDVDSSDDDEEDDEEDADGRGLQNGFIDDEAEEDYEEDESDEYSE